VRASVRATQTRTRNESEKVGSPFGSGTTDRSSLEDGFESEHSRWDPKDGDLFVCLVKPGETLVEACSDTDVQIVRPTCE